MVYPTRTRRDESDPTVNSHLVSKIAATFDRLQQCGDKALVIFVTGGDPPIDQLPAILRGVSDGGANIIEVGIPFSDPIADGPAIQASSQRALNRRVHVQDIFDAVRSSGISVPVVYMGYTNTALRHGFREFARLAADSGASGVLLSDLTPEEAGEWREAAGGAGLDTIFLVAPTSTAKRIRLACDAASGFVYCVSRTGVTGAANEVPKEVVETVKKVKAHTNLPVCVGFGISRPEQVRMVCDLADGAVVGSHIVTLLAETWAEGKGEEKVRGEIAALKSATKNYAS